MTCQYKLPELSFDYIRAARRSRGVLAKMNQKEVEALADRYRRFLRLKALRPDESIAPTEIIDEFWHLHMLHPRAYHRDCLNAFGFILDHAPGFGGDTETRPALEATFRRTSLAWEREYGEAYSLPGMPLQNVIICADEEDPKRDPKKPHEQPKKAPQPAPPPPTKPAPQAPKTDGELVPA